MLWCATKRPTISTKMVSLWWVNGLTKILWEESHRLRLPTWKGYMPKLRRNNNRWQRFRDKLSKRGCKMKWRIVLSSHRLGKEVELRWAATTLEESKVRAQQDSLREKKSSSRERRAGSRSRMTKRTEKLKRCNSLVTWAAIANRSWEREVIATQVEQVVMALSWIATTTTGEILELQATHPHPTDRDRDQKGCKMLSIGATGVDPEVDSSLQQTTLTPRFLLKMGAWELTDLVLSMMMLECVRTKKERPNSNLRENRKICRNSNPTLNLKKS